MPKLTVATTLALLAGIATARAATLEQVFDANTEALGSSPAELVDLGLWSLFVADDGVHGRELWRTDGTTAGTDLVVDLCPGPCDARPQRLTAWNGIAYFQATTCATGEELWRSDGTAAGTELVRDLTPGPESSSPDRFAIAGGRLFVQALSASGVRQLWSSDGTAVGTELVATISPRSATSTDVVSLATATVFLTVGASGHELWRTDGSAPGTSLLATVCDACNGNLPRIEASGGRAFLSPPGDRGLWASDGTIAGTGPVAGIPADADAWTPSAYAGGVLVSADVAPYGREPWFSDGTAAGTRLLGDLRSGPDGSDASSFEVHGGRALFRADSNDSGGELWSTDATAIGTRRIAEPCAGVSDCFWSSLSTRTTYLFQRTTLATGDELWVSDGTSPGTGLLVDLRPDAGRSNPWPMLELAGVIYFAADDGSLGREPYRTDGTPSGTYLLADGCPGSCSSAPQGVGITSAGAILSMAASGNRFEPWLSDGITAWPFASIGGGNGSATAMRPTVSSDAVYWWADRSATFQLLRHDGAATTSLGEFRYGGDLLDVDGVAYFVAATGEEAVELWRTDGTAAGTTLVQRTVGRFWGMSLAGARDGIVFFNRDARGAVDAWLTDGTTAGTQPIPGLISIDSLVELDAGAILAASGDEGSGIWRSDGTVAGTVPIAVLTSPAFVLTSRLVRLGDAAYFPASDGAAQWLWRSDGSSTGTTPIVQLCQRPVCSIELAAGRFVLYGAVRNGLDYELWRSDGTSAGTWLLASGWTSRPEQLTTVGDRLFFTAAAPGEGRELWTSDGLTETRRVAASPLPPYGRWPSLLGGEDVLFLVHSYGDEADELWRSDGTDAGTYPLTWFEAGCRGSWDVRPVAEHRGSAHFPADDGVTGRELWRLTPAFPDVGFGHPFYREVEALADAGVTRGCAVDLYCPNRTVDRGQMAAFLIRALGETPDPSPGSPFLDVAESHPFYAEIKRAFQLGISNGCGGGNYCPERAVDRGQMAAFLIRALGETPDPSPGSPFVDLPEGHPFYGEIKRLVQIGVTNGCAASPPRYCPEVAVSRGAMAAFLVRAFDL